MADIEIVKESIEGYTHQGHSATISDGYIKFRRSFRRQALKALRGAPLSVFLEVALADNPPDVQTICANTGYTSPATVCAALDLLVSGHFLEEVGRTGSNGVKRYRAVTYTWSGSDRDAPPDIGVSESRITRNEIRPPAPPTEIRPRELKSDVPQSEIRRRKSEIRARSTVVVVVDQNDLSTQAVPERQQQQTDRRVEKILAFLGVEGPFPRVPFEIAREWLYWHKFCVPESITDPPAFTAKRLRANSTAHPPQRTMVEMYLREQPHALDYVWTGEKESAEPAVEPAGPYEAELEF